MSVLRFDATVIGVISGKAILVRNEVPKTQVVLTTMSAEEDRGAGRSPLPAGDDHRGRSPPADRRRKETMNDPLGFTDVMDVEVVAVGVRTVTIRRSDGSEESLPVTGRPEARRWAAFLGYRVTLQVGVNPIPGQR